MTSRPPAGRSAKSIHGVFWSKQAWVSRASSRGRDRIKRPNLGDRKVLQESGLEPNTGVRPFVIIKMLWQTRCRQMTNFLLAMGHLQDKKGRAPGCAKLSPAFDFTSIVALVLAPAGWLKGTRAHASTASLRHAPWWPAPFPRAELSRGINIPTSTIRFQPRHFPAGGRVADSALARAS